MADAPSPPDWFRAAQREALDGQARSLSEGVPFQDAAAVLDRFDPETLRPTGGGPPGWRGFLAASAPARGTSGWALRDDVRARALRRMGTQAALEEALAANPDRPDTPVQRAFDAFLTDDDRIDRDSRADLVALIRVAEWLAVVDPEAADLAETARQALARADVLEPMRRLSGDVFVGREDELARLRAFVADREPGQLLTLSGPGGIGKSALLARFLLDVADGSDDEAAVPIAYVDLDRVRLDLTDPSVVLVEASAQLASQLPGFGFDASGERADAASQRSELFEASKGSQILNAGPEGSFAEAVRSVGGPVLLVVDTFEEAQYLGQEVAYGIWRMLGQLSWEALTLRVVVAGRVDPASAVRDALPFQSTIRRQAVPLRGLPDPPARDLVLSVLPAGAATTEGREAFVTSVVDLAEGNPLTLRLAAELAAADAEALTTPEGRAALLADVAAEGLQARLYGRVLGHIHDDRVRALAHPGLLVRRIDADVVREVLAEPCGIDLATPYEADDLVAALAAEVALVDRDPADDSLRHRQDVRRIMLRDLGQVVPPAVAAAIHDRAVAYYGSQDGPVARAEELYHRLMRGDGARALGQRWTDEAAAHLRRALDDLPDAGRLWLSKKLGVTPEPALRARADLREREAFLVQQTGRYLQNGLLERALGKLRAEPERTPTSPLHRVESEVLRGLGRLDEAAAVVLDALPGSRVAGDPAHLRDLLLQLGQIREAQGRLDDALGAAREALDRARHVDEPVDLLRALVLVLRLLRKLGHAHDDERRALIDDVLARLDDASLRSHPVLLRELTAEVGHVAPEVLDVALETIGVEIAPGDTDATDALAETLGAWNARLRRDGTGPSELEARAGLTDGSREAWAAYVEANLPGVGRDVRQWRAALPADRAVDKALVDTFRSTVDASLHGGLDRDGLPSF